MFRKILVANRGEIALRVIRACKELGIETVAVHSQADTFSLHIRLADEDVCIGPAANAESYLNIPRIISAAEVTGAEAIHPGYGFLAEDAHFAEVCESCGIVFIGPPPEVIRLMGDKAQARQQMLAAGVPVISGSEGPVEDVGEAQKLAEAIGMPVMIKACAGGGGRGMRLVESQTELQAAFNMARAEAQAAFGSPEVYIEKALDRPRHIEVQVLADNHGEVRHLGERECSIQRRHQKLIEECPSPCVDAALRERLGTEAVQGAKKAGYQSAGTVEFLLDSSGEFYFLEMNTRIQVEHPVTEAVMGLDLVKEQIRLAAGERMSWTKDTLQFRGHAIECRVNAEDARDGFAPRAGRVTTFHMPGGPGLRVDTHIYGDYTVPPYYDSLLAKVIAHGKTREEAIARMARALDELVIEGIPTTAPFCRAVMDDPGFRRGEYDTGSVARFLNENALTAEGAF